MAEHVFFYTTIHATKELQNYFVTIGGSSNEERDLDVINLVMGMDGHKIEMSRLINSWPTNK